MSRRDFAELSYKLHENHFNSFLIGSDNESQGKTWMQEDTVDYWRHTRMRDSIVPLLTSFPNTKWLTVGDGRYGSDARYIQQKGVSVVASDISDVLLQEAVKLGYIGSARQENAEQLSFSDSSFDFVLCKEAYHHFPRPMIALYEMLRVARKGVILIEPNDPFISESYVQTWYRKLKNIVFNRDKSVEQYKFERSGNYVYGISKREIEKVGLGLQLGAVAFKGLNDYYIKGVEYEKISDKSSLFRRIKFRIWLSDLVCRIKLRQYGLLVAVILIEPPDEKLYHALTQQQYEIIELPKNPYLTSDLNTFNEKS